MLCLVVLSGSGTECNWNRFSCTTFVADSANVVVSRQIKGFGGETGNRYRTSTGLLPWLQDGFCRKCKCAPLPLHPHTVCRSRCSGWVPLFKLPILQVLFISPRCWERLSQIYVTRMVLHHSALLFFH